MFASLDFIYAPSADVAADLAWFADVLGARVVFAIEAFGTRVAAVAPAPEGPPVLLAGHLGGVTPILVYRVGDLDRAERELRARGWEPGPRSGIPHGPICAFAGPGGHRLALYELTRPEAAARLEGRRDF